MEAREESGGENNRHDPSTLDFLQCTSLRSMAQQESLIMSSPRSTGIRDVEPLPLFFVLDLHI